MGFFLGLGGAIRARSAIRRLEASGGLTADQLKVLSLARSEARNHDQMGAISEVLDRHAGTSAMGDEEARQTAGDMVGGFGPIITALLAALPQIIAEFITLLQAWGVLPTPAPTPAPALAEANEAKDTTDAKGSLDKFLEKEENTTEPKDDPKTKPKK